MQFTDKELENLYRAIKILENGEGLLGIDIDKNVVETLVLKLKTGLAKNAISHINTEIEMLIDEAKAAFKEDSTYMSRSDSERAFNPSYPTRETIKVLNNAIEKGICVEVEYYSNSRGEFTKRKIEPETIERRSGRVYLNAFCHLRNEERVFRIDRIKNIRECD